MDILGPFIDIIVSKFDILMVHFAQGWIGYKVLFWGGTVLVCLGVVVGIGHTVLEGILISGMYVTFGLLIMKIFPHALPIYSLVVVGWSLLLIKVTDSSTPGCRESLTDG